MVKRFLLILFLAPIFALAQPKERSWYFEAGGSGGLGSFNFEKEIKSKTGLQYRYSIGLTGAPIDKNNGISIISPIVVKGIIGEGKHKAELGLGQGITITTKGAPWLMGLAILGYRFEHPDKKAFYRVTYTPLLSYIVDRQWQHWGGISIGWKLKEKDKNDNRKVINPSN